MDQYLDLIYKYYPKNIDPADLNYSGTSEITCQYQFLQKEQSAITLFDEMSFYLMGFLNCEYKTDLSLRGIFDPSRKTLFKLPNNRHHQEYPFCIVSVSALVPYFDIYYTKFKGIPINTITSEKITEGQDFLKTHIGNIISSYFNGYKLIPPEFSLNTAPAILSSRNYGKYATYYECLMTDTLW